MAKDYLHNHPEFPELLRIVSEETGIQSVLVEKDYWIMHCLYGLQKMELVLQMKGGTSLSKGHGLIQRFSEDIDILIEPPENCQVYTGKNHDKQKHRDSRKNYYDWLAKTIEIDGILDIKRDEEFDDTKKYRSGGIRLHYKSHFGLPKDIKEGILLEVGFDDVKPNEPKTISSWAYDRAKDKIQILDNRAIDVPCYCAGYTLVEKLQTISTKFRNHQENGLKNFPKNFIRHYYDVYCLLGNEDIQQFIGTEDYLKHKADRFPSADNKNIAENEAFIFSNEETYHLYKEQYQKSLSLYYNDKPTFEEIISRIKDNAARL